MTDTRSKKDIEDKQVSDIIAKINESLEKSLESSELENKQLSEKQSSLSKELKEIKQEKALKEDIHRYEKKSFIKNKKFTKISLAIVCTILLIVVLIPFENENIHLKSTYLISNLRGDTIDTWLTWRLTSGEPLHVSIVNADQYPSQKIQLIKDVLLSMDVKIIDNSLLGKGEGTSKLYVGWSGALTAASIEQTKFFIPNEINIIESDLGEGDITIKLVNLKNADGFSGFTKSIADETQNQILKSEIIIYEAGKISDDDLTKLVRHEFGHALGLGHSTAKEDLMYEIINMDHPLISECDVQVLKALYDGSQSSRVFCET